MRVPFSKGDFNRRVKPDVDLLLVNRWFEENPSLSDDGASLRSRPGQRILLDLKAEGPVRAAFSEAGSFNNDLFVVSNTTLYRVTNELEYEVIGTNFAPFELGGAITMTVTGNIGATPEYLFICDGQTLRVYDGTSLSQVATPDDVGIISVGTIAGFVIVVPAQGFGINGRFFWIEPGEITIDPLNFATAERSPDPVYSVVVLGDQFWLPGESTTEVWFMTGDPDAPVSRLQGVTFDRGTMEGTALQVKDVMVIVDADGGVFAIQGGAPQRISRPDIEAEIRRAIQHADFQESLL